MAVTKAQREATDRYIEKNNLVEIKFRVTDTKRTEYKDKASVLGYNSMNQFIIDSIDEKISREEK